MADEVVTCGPLDESYQFIFDFELFFRFAATAKIKKLERTQAFCRIHADCKTSSWDDFLVELYRFSRPLRPRRSAEFKQVLSEYVANYMQRRHGGQGTWALRLKAAWIRLLASTGWETRRAAGDGVALAPDLRSCGRRRTGPRSPALCCGLLPPRTAARCRGGVAPGRSRPWAGCPRRCSRRR